MSCANLISNALLFAMMALGPKMGLGLELRKADVATAHSWPSLGLSWGAASAPTSAAEAAASQGRPSLGISWGAAPSPAAPAHVKATPGWPSLGLSRDAAATPARATQAAATHEALGSSRGTASAFTDAAGSAAKAPLGLSGDDPVSAPAPPKPPNDAKAVLDVTSAISSALKYASAALGATSAPAIKHRNKAETLRAQRKMALEVAQRNKAAEEVKRQDDAYRAVKSFVKEASELFVPKDQWLRDALAGDAETAKSGGSPVITASVSQEPAAARSREELKMLGVDHVAPGLPTLE